MLLLGILLFSFAFRVIQIDTAFFGPEQAWIALDSWKLANLREFPTHMFNTSAGFSQLPLTIYITFIPYLFSDSVYALLIYYILLNVIAIGLCWWFTRRYWGWQAAAIATIVYASMPWAVIFSYFIWANTLLPAFVMIWVLGCSLAYAERRPRWAMLAWGLAWLAVQIHVSAFFLLAITLFLSWRTKVEGSWRYALVGSALALVPFLPWLYAQLTGTAQLGLDFRWSVGGGLRFNFQRIVEFLTARDLATHFISGGQETLAARLSYMTYLAPIWMLLYGLSLLYLFYELWRGDTKRRSLYLFIASWCVLPLGFSAAAHSTYTIVYLIPLLPIPCIALALLWKRVSERSSHLRLSLAVGILLLSALNLYAMWSVDQFIHNGIREKDPSSHAFIVGSWVYPLPLTWQLEIVEEMRTILEAGEVAGIIIMQYALPYESQYALRWPFPYHLRGYDVRTVNLNDQRLIYPEHDSLYLRNEREVSHNGAYSEDLEFLKQVGPYVLYLMPGGSGSAPQFPLTEQPGYANGLRLLGYDELMCDGNWRLHWAPPGAPGKQDEHVHFFIHLLGASGEALAQQDQRAFNARPWIPVDHREKDADDAWDWRVNDHVITSFDFGPVMNDLSIETIRVGLYTFSDETLSPVEGIYALDEQGRPWEYAVDIPFEGACSA